MDERSILLAAASLAQRRISPQQFLAAHAHWQQDKERPLADWLVELGFLPAEERRDFDTMLAERLKSTAEAEDRALASMATRAVQQALKIVHDPECIILLSQTLSAMGAAIGPPLGVGERTAYEWVKLLAKGGLGEVWIARDGELGRDIAIKSLRAELRELPEARRRFADEAKINGQLQHPGIVPVFHAGRHPATHEPYYAMRLVDGKTLAAAIDEQHARTRGKPFERSDWVPLLNAYIDVCQAVAYAHSRGILHRDLKPENILLGSFGEVFVIDWGLAKRVGATDAGSNRADEDGGATDSAAPNFHTAHGRRIGTPLWMSPEQAAGAIEQTGPWTDIYALGAILFAILTGKAPHADAGPTRDEVFERIARHSSPRVRSVVASLPAPLDAVAAKAMERERTARYATALALANDVQSWLSGQPVSVFREPPLQRLARWLLRHRGVGQLLAVLFVAVVVSAATGIATTFANQKHLEWLRFAQLGSQINLIAGLFEEDFRYLPRLQVVQAHSAVVQSVAKAHLDRDAAAQSQWKAEFARRLRAFVNNSFTIHSVSLIANDGRELARVHRVDGQMVDAPADELRSRQGEAAFVEAMRLHDNETLLDIVRMPHSRPGDPQRVFAVATPIFLVADGRRAGVLYTLLDESALYHRIIPDIQHRYVYLASADGDLLFDPYPTDAQAPLRLGRPVQTTLPSLAPLFSPHPAPSVESRSLDGNWIIHAKRVAYGNNQSFALVTMYSRESTFGEAQLAQRTTITIGAIALALALAFAVGVARVVARTARGG